MSDDALPRQRCPICRHLVQAEPSYPGGDAPCPRCGQLLWWFQQRLSETLGVGDEQIDATFVDDLKTDSLDIVELVMEIEEEYGIPVSDDLSRFRNIPDIIRYLRRKQDEDDSDPKAGC